jgi:hypothetical protein
MFALRGEGEDIVRTFGSEALARVLYEAHRDEINASGRAGWRSGAWWLWESDAPKELLRRPTARTEAIEVSSEDEARQIREDEFADEDEFEAKRVEWLHSRGMLQDWERRDLLEIARRDVDPSNPYFGPNERQQEIARRLIEALEDSGAP